MWRFSTFHRTILTSNHLNPMKHLRNHPPLEALILKEDSIKIGYMTYRKYLEGYIKEVNTIEEKLKIWK